MKALALTICACAACGVDNSQAVTEPDRVTLPSDAWFGGFGATDHSVDDCIARQDPSDAYGIWQCSFEIVLCHSGRAGMLTGDVVANGTYSMHESVALIDLDNDGGSHQVYFDLATGVTVDEYNSGLHWLPDIDQRWAHLEQFGFDCGQVP